MDQLNYKERLEALRKGGFTDLEISRLYHFRQVYVANPMDQAPAVRSLARRARQADRPAYLKRSWPYLSRKE
jgi:hypothetical protein